jgi:hypothetical protein
MSKRFVLFSMSFSLMCLSMISVAAQQTAITYQGKLTDNGSPANGNYDLQFVAFDSEVGGSQVGVTQTVANVPVVAGVFTVTLDFGGAIFNGGSRYLEISMRSSGAASFTLLNPRQRITATPYALRSVSSQYADVAIDAQKLEGQTAANFVQATDVRLADSRIPLPGSPNYIQNSTTAQPNSNFNVSGDGTLGGNLGVGTGSPKAKLHVVGPGMRLENSTYPRFSWNFTGGATNEKKWQIGATFHALRFTMSDDDELIERTWLQVNRTGFTAGNLTLQVPRVGIGTFMTDPKFGLHLVSNDKPNVRVESTGFNVFPRLSWHYNWGTGDWTKWQVYAAGSSLNFTTLNDAEDQEDVWLRVERTANSVNRAVFPRPIRVETNVSGGIAASFGTQGDFQIDSVIYGTAGRFVVKENGRVGIGRPNPADSLDVDGAIRFGTLGLGGTSSLCLNTLHQISGCSSSLRYKTDLHPFTSGLNLINRLQPLTFRWKADQSLDLGLGAVDVAAAEPLLVTHNAKGEVEGVKYDRLSAVFINAFKEQQAQIERQQAEAERQQNQIALLRTANAGLNARLQTIEKALKKPARLRHWHH